MKIKVENKFDAVKIVRDLKLSKMTDDEIIYYFQNKEKNIKE